MPTARGTEGKLIQNPPMLPMSTPQLVEAGSHLDLAEGQATHVPQEQRLLWEGPHSELGHAFQTLPPRPVAAELRS